MSAYRRLLEQYARFVGLSPADAFLETEEVIIGGINIGLMPEAEDDDADLVFFARLGIPVKSVDQNELNRLMLEANAFWAGTGGCTLGIQAETSAVLLCARTGVRTSTASSLAAALNAFADVAQAWKEVVEGRLSLTLSRKTA